MSEPIAPPSRSSKTTSRSSLRGSGWVAYRDRATYDGIRMRNRTDTFLIWLLAASALAGLLVSGPPTAHARESLTTWRWEDECGALEVTYPVHWEAKLVDVGQFGCNGALSYIPGGVLPAAKDGVVISISFSRNSDRAASFYEKLLVRTTEEPQRAFSFSGLRCIKERVAARFTRFKCAAHFERGIYTVAADIPDPSQKGYESEVIAVLSSFTVSSP
jgi:hypothetical protein